MQTAVEWIVDQMLSEGHKEMWKDMIQQAKQMEKEQKEISDEEIEKTALEYFADYKGGASEWEILAFIMGMKKYREQLKSK